MVATELGLIVKSHCLIQLITDDSGIEGFASKIGDVLPGGRLSLTGGLGPLYLLDILPELGNITNLVEDRETILR